MPVFSRSFSCLSFLDPFLDPFLGIYGHLTRRNLAAQEAERGDVEDETRLSSEVLAECPGDCEAAARLARLSEERGQRENAIRVRTLLGL